MLSLILALSLFNASVNDTIIDGGFIVGENEESDTPGAVIYLPTEIQEILDIQSYGYDETQPHLTKQGGVFYGPNGKETYYNLNMNKCIEYMNNLGYNYEVWVRADGVKMFGNYVMIAVNTYTYPKGTILETSLGTGIVVDHCVAGNVDIAVTW